MAERVRRDRRRAWPGHAREAAGCAPRDVYPVLEAFAEPAALIESDGSIGYANGRLLRLLGYETGEAAGRPFEDFCDLRGLYTRYGVYGGIVRLVIRCGPILHAPLECLRKNGSRVPVSFSASRLPSSPGAPPSCIASATDRSEEREIFRRLASERDELAVRVEYLEEFREGVFDMLKDLDWNERELEGTCSRLKEAQEQIIHTSRMKALGELSSGLVHELSQPLTVIKGLAHSMTGGSTERSGEKLALIFKASMQMEEVIKHLKLFSRREEPEMGPVDLSALI